MLSSFFPSNYFPGLSIDRTAKQGIIEGVFSLIPHSKIAQLHLKSSLLKNSASHGTRYLMTVKYRTNLTNNSQKQDDTVASRNLSHPTSRCCIYNLLYQIRVTIHHSKISYKTVMTIPNRHGASFFNRQYFGPYYVDTRQCHADGKTEKREKNDHHPKAPSSLVTHHEYLPGSTY